jgi:hypothetical protein
MSLSASLVRKTVQPWIVYAKSHWAENYCSNSKSGVNFQVELKQNCAERNYIKWYMPVL